MTRPLHVSGPYLDNANEWRWSIVAGNGETIAVSSEGYKNRADCVHGKELARQALNLEHGPVGALFGLGAIEQNKLMRSKPGGVLAAALGRKDEPMSGTLGLGTLPANRLVAAVLRRHFTPQP